MKRIFILIIGIALLCTSLEARVVSVEQAQKVAGIVLKHNVGNGCLAKPAAKQESLTKGAADSAPEFHIFNGTEGGFVIVSGDDSVSPVIGYSDKGEFVTEGMPENISAWLDMWKAIIRSQREKNASADQATASEWAVYNAGNLPTKGEKKLLETADWDQGAPYNLLCPDFGKGTTITGCTATSTAIIMRYHKWPVSGTGKLPSYNFVYDGKEQRHVEGHYLGHKYNWDKMPLKYTASATLEEKQAVAQLMLDVGVMHQSMYGTSREGGTGAWVSNTPAGLKKYFKYDASAEVVMESMYSSAAEYCQVLRDNIDNVGPIQYAGFSTSGGHAFVLDGYDGEKFHINWGWGGSDNGYYTYPWFAEYTEGQYCIINLMKDQSAIGYKVGFNKTSKLVTVTTGEEVIDCSVKNSKGQEFTQCLEIMSDSFVIDSNKLPLDSYTVSFRTESKSPSVIIKMGNK